MYMAVGGLVAVALAFAAGWVAARATAPDPVSFATEQRGHLARLDAASAPGRVVFLGSSTFQGLDVSAVTTHGLNLAMGGDTQAGLARRMAGYRASGAAAAVWLNIGLNDVLQNCALPATPLAELLAHIPRHVPVLVLAVQSLAPARADACGGRANGLVEELNAGQARACATRAGCTFVPHPLDTRDGAADPASWEADGVHLSASGYAQLVSRMRRALGVVRPDLVAAPAEAVR